jgi:hypothetical protein
MEQLETPAALATHHPIMHPMIDTDDTLLPRRRASQIIAALSPDEYSSFADLLSHPRYAC